MTKAERAVYMVKWLRANRESVRARKKAYRKAHPELKAAEDARRYARYRSRIKAAVAAYRKANPEKLKAKDQAYAKARPDVIRATSSRKHARKRYAPGRGISTREWNNLFAESLGICAYCNERYSLELDHIDPLSKGGAHDVDNAAPVCRVCNSSKNDTPLLLWLAIRRARAA